MLLLLPPSEGKHPGGELPWVPGSGRYGRQLRDQRASIIDKLRDGHVTLPAGARRPVLVGLPASQRYSGVVWKHLSPGTLDDPAAHRAHLSLTVVSAVGGLFAFNDLVPDYKLKVGASIPDLGRVATFWQPHLGAVIAEELTTSRHDRSRYVIDLLAVEQAGAIIRPDGVAWYRCELVGPSGERAGHNGKAAKGRFARHLLSVDDPLPLLDGWADPDGWTVRVS